MHWWIVKFLFSCNTKVHICDSFFLKRPPYCWLTLEVLIHLNSASSINHNQWSLASCRLSNLKRCFKWQIKICLIDSHKTVKAIWEINGLPHICNQVSFLALEWLSDVVPMEFVRAGSNSIMCWKDPLKFLFKVKRVSLSQRDLRMVKYVNGWLNTYFQARTRVENSMYK